MPDNPLLHPLVLQHLGVASTDGPGFSPGPEDPVYHYHSIYDSEFWMEKFGDVGFHRHGGYRRLRSHLRSKLTR